jgi:hypothetical protein
MVLASVGSLLEPAFSFCVKFPTAAFYFIFVEKGNIFSQDFYCLKNKITTKGVVLGWISHLFFLDFNRYLNYKKIFIFFDRS